MSEKIKNFLFSAFLVVITGGLCSYFTNWGITNWYGFIPAVAYTPPNYVFSIAWSLIYAGLTISYWRVLNTTSEDKKYAGSLFLLQLILQIVWCFLFFYKGMVLAGFVVILWLIFTVLRMIKVFTKIDMTAGVLNYFYILYISFAAFLNLSFMYANGYIVNF